MPRFTYQPEPEPERTPTMKMDDRLTQELADNEQVIHVLDHEVLMADYADAKGIAKTAAGYKSTVDDLNTARLAIQELGISPQKVVIKQTGGRRYVIFKGNPKQRQLLRGTRYRLSNPKVVRLAIGPKNVLKSVKGGAVVTVVLSVGVEVLDFLLRDEATLHELLGTVTGDLIKVGLSSLAAAAAGLAAGSVTVLAGSAAAPLLVAVAVGVAAGWVLDKVDKRVGATAALIETYRKMGVELAEIEAEIDEQLREAERTWNWLEMNPCAIEALFGNPNACVGY